MRAQATAGDQSCGTTNGSLGWWDSFRSDRAAGGMNLTVNCESLLSRFRNGALDHRLTQIAQDGSRKVPQRLVAPLLELLERGAEANALALALAGWMRWQEGVDDVGVA